MAIIIIYIDKMRGLRGPGVAKLQLRAKGLNSFIPHTIFIVLIH